MGSVFWVPPILGILNYIVIFNLPHINLTVLVFRVINEELAAKITENARLHATLDDIEKQYESTIQTLQSRVQQLEKEYSKFWWWKHEGLLSALFPCKNFFLDFQKCSFGKLWKDQGWSWSKWMTEWPKSSFSLYATPCHTHLFEILAPAMLLVMYYCHKGMFKSFEISNNQSF